MIGLDFQIKDIFNLISPPTLPNHKIKDKRMILSTMRMALPVKKRDEAIKILKLTTECCKVQPGCLGCYIYEDLQQKNIILFFNEWRSKANLDHFLRSDHYRNTLLVLEMAENEPELRFDEIFGSTGMETVEKARQCDR